MTLKSPNIGGRELVYENREQKLYKVCVDFGTHSKDIYISNLGERAGIVVAQGDSVLMISQYRLIINGLSLEIPGGNVAEGESAEGAAVRECLEGTGIRCLNPRPLLFYQAGLDTRYNPTHLFYSDEVAEGTRSPNGSAEEWGASEWLPLDRCIEMITHGLIVDAFSILGLFAYHALRRDATILASEGCPATGSAEFPG
jgi:8-oxo-dGTP pyrophosphatase MutT (NUDIX family)